MRVETTYDSVCYKWGPEVLVDTEVGTKLK